MPKQKDGLALFELLKDGELSGEPPDAPDSRQRTTETAGGPGSPAAEAKRPAQPERVGPREGAGAPPGGENLPLVEVIGGQVRVSLTSVGLAVVVFVVGVLLFGAYWLGLGVGVERGEQAGYQAAVQDDIQAGRAELPTDGLFDGVGASPVTYGSDSPTRASTAPQWADDGGGVPWVTGYTYIVVQDFRADAREDALTAQQYLRDNGVEAELIELGGDWKYRLIAAQGFNRDDPVQREQADRFLSQVRSLGEAYFKAGGRYRLEGYFKKLTAETW